MENEILLKCIVCNENANFICQRCSEAYCTEECQIVHWPMHRIQCFPMPNLLPATNLMLPLYDIRSRSTQYPAINNSAIREIALSSLKSELKSNSNNSITMKPTKKMIKTKEPHSEPRINRNFPSFTKSQRNFSSSSESADLVKQIYPFPGVHKVQKSRKSKHNSKADRPVKQSEKWEQQFPFDTDEAVIAVVVQYFTESPTTTCWVIQRKRIDERNELMKKITDLQSSVETIQAGDVKLNELFCVLHEGVYHRGVLVYRINSQEVLVRLIDNGRTIQTRITAIRPLNKVLRDVYAFAFEINFDALRDVAIDAKLRVESISTSADGVINVRVAEKRQEEYKFTQNDIDSIRIPVNVPSKLFCLDYSNIEMGYISTCINDPQKIKSINAISDKISKYCKQLKDVQNYCPQLKELCLVYLNDESQWYRAECVQVIVPETFLVTLIDYGCIRSVNSKNIRKMVKQFLEPTIMQMCRIHGIPEKPNNDVVEKILSYFNENLIFRITNAEDCSEPEGAFQLIYVPDLPRDIMGR